MKVLFLNNNGAGFADYVEVAEGTNVEKFFEEHMSEGEPADYLIRVNRQPVPRSYVLQEADRISFTPVKIEGALA